MKNAVTLVVGIVLIGALTWIWLSAAYDLITVAFGFVVAHPILTALGAWLFFKIAKQNREQGKV